MFIKSHRLRSMLVRAQSRETLRSGGSKKNLEEITTEEINDYKQKLALLSPVEQLDYVKKYFMLYDNYKNVKRPEDIYILIFGPRATGKGDNVPIYKKFLTKKVSCTQNLKQRYLKNKIDFTFIFRFYGLKREITFGSLKA